MPQDGLSDALKEAYACADSNEPILETVQISHPNLDEPIYLVCDRQDWVFKLEDSTTKTFEKATFDFTLPPTGENGMQELGLAMDNVDQRIGDFVDKVKGSIVPVVVTYRPYLVENALIGPERNPPLELFLSDIEGDDFGFTGKASFTDLVNKKFLADLYTRNRFPGLAN